ncbi:unnamed protein product [Rhizophagus irregularis]|nr:unnamed protein product [Rhizophagus irregularis]
MGTTKPACKFNTKGGIPEERFAERAYFWGCWSVSQEIILFSLIIQHERVGKEQIDKIDKFRLDTDLCMPHSNINQFFAKTCLSKWNNVSIFAKFIYNESPSTTPKQVLDMYNRNRFDIISTKDTKNNVMQYVRDIIVKIEQAKCLKSSKCKKIRAKDWNNEEAIDGQDQEEVKDATSGEEAKKVTKVARENK